MTNPVAVKSVVGTLVSQGDDPLLQYKGFSFGNNFGVVGWFYSRFLFTLQRRSPNGQRPTGEFIVDFHVASTGRQSTDSGAHYAIVLLNGSTPLRTIDVGYRHVPCGEDSAQIQSAIPDMPGWDDGFPLDFFSLINSARLEIVIDTARLYLNFLVLKLSDWNGQRRRKTSVAGSVARATQAGDSVASPRLWRDADC